MGQQYAGINNKYGKKGHLYDLSAKLLSQTKGSFYGHLSGKFRQVLFPSSHKV